jgi:hypothetical protein
MDGEGEMLNAFAAVLRAEQEVSAAKTVLDEAVTPLRQKLTGAETRLTSAWVEVERLMGSTGEFEVLLPGDVTDYKISFSTPRESVDVDADAVPDEFCKIERKPKLKEIGEHLKGLRDSDQPLPNWGRFKLGERKLGWKAIKKTMAA